MDLVHLLRANRLAIAGGVNASKFSVRSTCEPAERTRKRSRCRAGDGKDIHSPRVIFSRIRFIWNWRHVMTRLLPPQRCWPQTIKKQQRRRRSRDDPSCALSVYDHDTTPIIIASLVITRTQVRFYPAARTVVNIFAPRQFRGARASRVLAMASSPSRTSLTYSIKPAMKAARSSFRRAPTSTRDACAT